GWVDRRLNSGAHIGQRVPIVERRQNTLREGIAETVCAGESAIDAGHPGWVAKCFNRPGSVALDVAGNAEDSAAPTPYAGLGDLEREAEARPEIMPVSGLLVPGILAANPAEGARQVRQSGLRAERVGRVRIEVRNPVVFFAIAHGQVPAQAQIQRQPIVY